MDKHIIWNKQRELINQLCDGRQKTIDEGIKETVTALNVLGLVTKGSCEGHDDWGLPFPWIDIECDLRRNATEKQQEYLAVRLKVIDLIEEFYLERNSLKWSRIIPEQNATWIRVQSVIADAACKFPKDSEEFKLIRKNTTEEMRLFTEFLKQKFFNS
jgi:hypothetical protein